MRGGSGTSGGCSQFAACITSYRVSAHCAYGATIARFAHCVARALLGGCAVLGLPRCGRIAQRLYIPAARRRVRGSALLLWRDSNWAAPGVPRARRGPIKFSSVRGARVLGGASKAPSQCAIRHKCRGAGDGRCTDCVVAVGGGMVRATSRS